MAFVRLDPAHIAGNLERVRERIGPAVRICAAIKYVPADELAALAEAGIEVVGENRAQDLVEKQDRLGRDAFREWHFIGALQSRKVRDVAPRVSLIHSVASDSALNQLEKHPAQAVLIQVNVRVPHFLLPILEERGFDYEIHEPSPERVVVRIWRASPDASTRESAGG